MKPKYKYESLIDVLSQKAAALPTGSKLPSIRSLMQRYGYTLQTVNSALNELERKGQIQRRRGSGIYTCKETATRLIELHWPLFIASGPDSKQIAVSNAIKAEGWTISTRLHHVTLDDPTDTPDPAASAHVLFPNQASQDRLFFKLLLEQNVPIVMLGRHVDPKFDSITSSDHQVISPMIRHLISLGHSRFAYLTNEPINFDSQRRKHVFSEVLSIFALPPPIVIDPGTKDGELGSLTSYAALKNYLANFKGGKLPFTALITATPPGSRGAIRAFYEAGISVPQQCSIGTLTLDPENPVHMPSITDAGTPHEAFGTAVIEILQKRFAGYNGEAIHLELPPTLNIRESTGPAP